MEKTLSRPMGFVISHAKRLSYIERRLADFKALHLSNQNANQNPEQLREALLMMLHQLKGNAKTFGFEDLGTQAINFEKKIKDDAELSVAAMQTELQGIIKQMEIGQASLGVEV